MRTLHSYYGRTPPPHNEAAMHDRDIRAALHASELSQHIAEPDTLILDELGICQGDYRVDVAVVNGALHGYEIKSDRDTLARLPAQVAAYGRVFDFLTLVTGPRYADRVSSHVPDWWGVMVAEPGGGDALVLSTVRHREQNPQTDIRATAELLWKEEALAVLTERVPSRGLKSKPRGHLWDMLAAEVPEAELRAIVRATLKGREQERWKRLASGKGVRTPV